MVIKWRKDKVTDAMEGMITPQVPQASLPSMTEYRHAYDLAQAQRSMRMGTHPHTTARTTFMPDPVDDWAGFSRTLVAMRLGIREGHRLPFEFLDFMKGTECVFVMVAKTNADKPVVIEDDLGLFPSDTLITQLRLMMG